MAKDKVVVEIVAKDKTKKGVDSATKSFGQMAKTLGPLIAGGFGVAAIKGFTDAMLAATIESQKLNASLISVTGSQDAATKSMKMLKEFAKTTPFQLNQVTDAFIKMKALGLDASAEALRSYGNTASAMGKDLNQMIEAVADASTGEFERLKEFGIKSKSEGDNVSFTFQGVTTTVKKSADAITGYLEGIGNNKFGDAMSQQMNTIGGALSNLEGSWTSFLVTLGETGIADQATAAIRELTFVLTELEKVFEETTDNEKELESLIEQSDLLNKRQAVQNDLAEKYKNSAGAQAAATKNLKRIEEERVAVWERITELRGEIAAAEPPASVAPSVPAAQAPTFAALNFTGLEGDPVVDMWMQRAVGIAEIDASILSQQIAQGELLTDTWLKVARDKEGIDQRSADAKQQLLELELQREEAKNKALGDLASLMNSKNREAFEVGKVAAIAQTTISTYESATASYKALSGIPYVGPALGVAAAAAAVAAGLSNVQKISSTKFGGGGPSGAATPNITTGGDVIGPVIQPAGQTSAQIGGQPIVVEGNSLLAVMVEEQLIPAMNEAISRGVQLVIV